MSTEKPTTSPVRLRVAPVVSVADDVVVDVAHGERSHRNPVRSLDHPVTWL